MTTTAPRTVPSAAGPDPGAAPPAARGADPAPDRLRLLVGAPVAVLGGVTLDTAFPGFGFWPAALVAPAALLIALRGRGPGTGYLLGVLFGLGFFVPHLQWSGTYVGALPWLSLALLQALILGLVGALWPACWRLAARPGLGWTLPLTAAAVWVAVEGVRARAPFDGFPWGRVGFSQSESPLAWAVAIGGVPAVSGVVVAVSAGLALLAVALLPPRRGRQWRPAALVAIGTIGGAAILAAVGWWAGDTARPGDGNVTVAAVQGNVPRPGLGFNDERRAVTDNHARATQALAAEIEADRVPAVDLVVWPENASDIDPLRNPDAAEVISRAADAVQAPVLVGAVLREPGDNLTNAVLVWDPETGYRGDEGGRYAKQAPAPFAEYIPYRDVVRRITSLVDEVPRDFVAGPGPGVLTAGGASVGPGICFEVASDAIVGEQVRSGADLLAIPTNNATFGFSDESTQQIVMSKLRAMEHGRAVVHASTVGVSDIFQPDGSSTRRTELFTQDVVVADVPLRAAVTPATRLGQWPELAVLGAVCLATGALLAAGIGRRVRRAPSPGSATPDPAGPAR